jgi:hypothetical protein
MKAPALALVVGDVIAERYKQDAKWGEQNHPSVERWAICEDYMEPKMGKARERCDTRAMGGTLAWADILVEEVAEAIDAAVNGDDLRDELIQVAAVAVAWVECLDRNAQ